MSYTIPKVNFFAQKYTNIFKRLFMVRKIINFGKQLVLGERTPGKLAYASSIGIFIAFSPFVGFHWLMTLVLAWLLGLNVVAMYTASHIVNNPFTMVFIYLADYKVGNFIAKLVGIDLFAYNPWWMHWLNTKFACVGIPQLSLIAFLIGGNILGFLAACIAYPFLIHFYKRIIKQPAV